MSENLTPDDIHPKLKNNYIISAQVSVVEEKYFLKIKLKGLEMATLMVSRKTERHVALNIY